jgi:hypothetical protein
MNSFQFFDDCDLLNFHEVKQNKTKEKKRKEKKRKEKKRK